MNQYDSCKSENPTPFLNEPLNPNCLKERIHKKTNRGRKSIVELPQGKKCDICLELLQYSQRHLVKCTICFSEFHSSCYKYPILNEDSFACERCTIAKQASKPIESYTCFLCERSDGVLYHKENTTKFYHEICWRLIPELNEEGEEGEGVKGNLTKTAVIPTIRRWRYKNSCKYCKDKLSKSKVVIKCANPKCKCFYHIPCAIQKGLIFPLKFQLSFYNIYDNQLTSIPFYCTSHNKRLFNAYRNELFKLQMTMTMTYNEVSCKETCDDASLIDYNSNDNDIEKYSIASSNALNLNFNDLIDSTIEGTDQMTMTMTQFNENSLTDDINLFEINEIRDELFFPFDFSGFQL